MRNDFYGTDPMWGLPRPAPCPWCLSPHVDLDVSGYALRCMDCGISLRANRPTETFAAWNALPRPMPGGPAACWLMHEEVSGDMEWPWHLCLPFTRAQITIGMRLQLAEPTGWELP